MKTIKITKNIVLPPSILKENLINTIYNSLKKNISNESSLNTGLIIDIDKDSIVIKDNKVLITGNTQFMIEFYAETIKPCEGDLSKGKVILLSESGIIVDMYDIKTMIPKLNLINQGYKYDKTILTYIKDENKISLGDILDIKITKVRYERKKFSCIGELI